MTLVVGVLVVAVSAAGFAFSMFGRRPPLQPATAVDVPVPAAVVPSREDSAPGRRRGQAKVPRHSPQGDVPRLEVEIPTAVRMRSAFLLGLGVLTAAVVLGILLSVIVVGAFTLIG